MLVQRDCRACSDQFKVQVDQEAEYRGKETPHGKKCLGVKPVRHGKKYQCQEAEYIDESVT